MSSSLEVNWHKCCLLAERIKEVQMYQKSGYSFDENKNIQEKFLLLKTVDDLEDNIFYEVSLYIEPRAQVVEKKGQKPAVLAKKSDYLI